MRCVKCSKDIPPGAAFCASCGARVKAAQPAGEKKGGAPWLAIGSIVAGVGILGASGYWGYANYAAKEEAAQKAADAEKAATPVSMKKAAPVSAEDAAERAEILAAQQALSKAILAEEALAKAKAGAR